MTDDVTDKNANPDADANAPTQIPHDRNNQNLTVEEKHEVVGILS